MIWNDAWINWLIYSLIEGFIYNAYLLSKLNKLYPKFHIYIWYWIFIFNISLDILLVSPFTSSDHRHKVSSPIIVSSGGHSLHSKPTVYT